ncbi:MAG TPA: hypothetical protein VGN34_02825 [Ktedonobacteraceae bacterium]
MSWTVEHHTGTMESFNKNGFDHVSHYDTEDEARAAIMRIFNNSLINQEHRSPIVLLRYEGDE